MRYFNAKLALFGALSLMLCAKGVEICSSRGVFAMSGEQAQHAPADEAKRIAAKAAMANLPAHNPFEEETKSLRPKREAAERTTLPVAKASPSKARKNVAHSAAGVKKNTAAQQKRAAPKG